MAFRQDLSGVVPLTTTGAPSTPATDTTAGGTITGTTYYVKITYTNALGESLPSVESSQIIATNNLLTITSPAAKTGATGWYPYVSVTTDTEKRQGTTPIAIGTDYTQPLTDITTTGPTVPTVDTSGIQIIPLTTAASTAYPAGLTIERVSFSSNSSTVTQVILEDNTTPVFEAFVVSPEAVEDGPLAASVAPGHALNLVLPTGAASISIAYNVQITY